MINLLKTAQELFTEDTKKRNSSFIVDSIIGTILLAIKKYNESEANILIYAANNYDANQIYNKLSSLIDEDKIILLPGDDLIRVEYISESKEIRSELIYGLYKIRHAHHSIIIATPSTIYRYYPSVDTFDNSFIDIHVGDDIDVNHHANNSDYVVWALESLPFEFRLEHAPKKIDIKFRKEIGLGGTVVSEAAMIQNDELITLHSIKRKSDNEELASLKIVWF